MSTETTQTGFRIYTQPAGSFYWSEERLLEEVATVEEVLPAARRHLRAAPDQKLFFHPEFEKDKMGRGWFGLSGMRVDSGGNEILVQVHCLAGEIPESLRPR